MIWIPSMDTIKRNNQTEPLLRLLVDLLVEPYVATFVKLGIEFLD
jgi:hypothetical protein